MAGRPRLPAEVAKVTGAVAKNAGRFQGRAAPKVKSLGPPPARLSEAQQKLWKEFNDDFPWLGRSDRGIVSLAVLLQSQIEAAGDEATPPMIAQMRLLLSSMGGTPVDRSKVAVPDDPEEDPLDEFVN
jgi:hypothetical protein